MKNFNFKSKSFYTFIAIVLFAISPVLSQVELKPIGKPIKTELKLKSTNHPNSILFNKIKVINNINYSNYVYTFYTKNNRTVNGTVKEVKDGYVKVKIQEGYKEHKYMFLPFDSISHFQEHYSGE
ncbi:hypothetical protein [Tenacibaculum aquimarinum]|uniref:hypothetical protein n=1 Tax=Tenacibaculum aquimarinum TaxID=2910675 RepID=UPI001F0B4D73|nr:hypothetical protein [Tenacibaculum aquimarinum]MCH3883096.1 hypothetical protein [Tenacibaculum aquimarinum]